MILMNLMIMFRADLAMMSPERPAKKGQCKLPLKYDNCFIFYVFLFAINCSQYLIFSGFLQALYRIYLLHPEWFLQAVELQVLFS